MFRRPPSLRRVAVDGRSPGFIGTTRTLRLPGHPSRRSFVFLRYGRYHGGAGVFAPTRRPTRRRRAGVLLCGGHPCAAVIPWKWPELPSSRRTLLSPRTCSFDPGRTGRNSPCAPHPTRPRLRERPGLLRGFFRGSIAWLDDSLSTLRSMRLPAPHARLASGCWLSFAVRDLHPQGSTQRFQSCFSFTSLPPLASLLGAIPFNQFSCFKC